MPFIHFSAFHYPINFTYQKAQAFYKYPKQQVIEMLLYVNEEVAGATVTGRNMAGATFGGSKYTKVSLAGAFHKFPEYSVSRARAFRKSLWNLEKDTSVNIRSIKRMIKSSSEKSVLNSYTSTSFKNFGSNLPKCLPITNYFSQSCKGVHSPKPFMTALLKNNGRYRERRSDRILGTFYRDSLRTQRFQTLISLLFEDHWVWN